MTLYEKKWLKFLKRIWLFRFIPFVDFVLAAGSLATGNMNENSDFDVIVGVRQGRIFTARAFCILAFGMFGWRRKGTDHKKSAKDKICFNHFVTPAAYRLSPPHNEYWRNLYQKLVPVYGDSETIQKFFDANADWSGGRRIDAADGRYAYKNKSWFKKIKEWSLDNWFGDWLENKLKALQIKTIKKSLKSQSGYKPRIIYSDNELEFHPDTTRTYLSKNSYRDIQI